MNMDDQITPIYLKQEATCVYCNMKLPTDTPYSAWPKARMSSRRMALVNHHGGSYHKVRIGRVVKDENGIHLVDVLKGLYPPSVKTCRTD